MPDMLQDDFGSDLIYSWISSPPCARGATLESPRVEHAIHVMVSLSSMSTPRDENSALHCLDPPGLSSAPISGYQHLLREVLLLPDLDASHETYITG